MNPIIPNINNTINNTINNNRLLVLIHPQKQFNISIELNKLNIIQPDWIINVNLLQNSTSTWFPASFRDESGNMPLVGMNITLEDLELRWNMINDKRKIIFTEVLKSLENDKINHQIKDYYCLVGDDKSALENNINLYLDNYRDLNRVEDRIVGMNDLVEQWSIFKSNTNIYLDLPNYKCDWKLLKEIAHERMDYKGDMNWKLMERMNEFQEVWVLGFSKTHVYWSIKDILLNNKKLFNKIKIISNYLLYERIEDDLRMDYKEEIDTKLMMI